ncbi:uncharacterized protein MONBRDRAFT_22028 [Monosiga brevicollis MX1]|uniref:Uncharacterized protein n=1 Tax=Monosiga brevicollis TaxID=81824 RepID=A9UPB9_MONBE|nr:uncharacterized protein MONBRDRAFT_22028 [Monosiga brevicollis MX1]EDQ92390.1 predicted protein [Monosiga brevicollis MX1]|eukprot:XP_001742152.1 hypothetical protein [Monosiga brevicollis MX1]
MPGVVAVHGSQQRQAPRSYVEGGLSQFKALGAKAFQSGEYALALQCYQQAILRARDDEMVRESLLHMCWFASSCADRNARTHPGLILTCFHDGERDIAQRVTLLSNGAMSALRAQWPHTALQLTNEVMQGIRPVSGLLGCVKALRLDEAHIKTLYRKAMALRDLNQMDAAMGTCRTLLQLEPANKATRVLLKSLETALIGDESQA